MIELHWPTGEETAITCKWGEITNPALDPNYPFGHLFIATEGILLECLTTRLPVEWRGTLFEVGWKAGVGITVTAEREGQRWVWKMYPARFSPKGSNLFLGRWMD